MDENVRLYVHWIFCIGERCQNFKCGCRGIDGRCSEPDFFELEGFEADKVAALEKNDSTPEPDISF